jgi:hypothetical protein
MKLCNVSVAVDRDSALQELWDCHCVIAVPMCDETGVNAARFESAPDLDALERDACIQEQACLAIPDKVGITTAPGRDDLDVH